MREIKFRGKRIDNDEWEFGSYHYSNDGKYHYILNREKFIPYEGTDKTTLWKSEVNSVNHESVSQFTGLKDKNGKEIYDGDILFVQEDDDIEDMGRNYTVEWGNEYPAFNLKEYEDLEYNSLQHACLVVRCEVVGNIYENPELLTDKK